MSLPKTEEDLQNLPPLGRFLYDHFLWKQRPNWTLPMLARKAGISGTTIFYVVIGRGKPSPLTLRKIHAAMVETGSDITLEELFDVAGMEMPVIELSPVDKLIDRVGAAPISSTAKDELLQLLSIWKAEDDGENLRS